MKLVTMNFVASGGMISGQIRVLWSSPEPVNILDLILGIDRVEVVDEEEVDVFQVAEIMGDTNVDAPIQVFGSAK